MSNYVMRTTVAHLNLRQAYNLMLETTESRGGVKWLPRYRDEVRAIWEAETFENGYALPGLNAEQVTALGKFVGVEFIEEEKS